MVEQRFQQSVVGEKQFQQSVPARPQFVEEIRRGRFGSLQVQREWPDSRRSAWRFQRGSFRRFQAVVFDASVADRPVRKLEDPQFAHGRQAKRY